MAEKKVPRDEKGRLTGGQGALNPGGEPKWVNAVKSGLQTAAEETSRFVLSVIKGEPQKMTIQGEVVEVTPSIENRLKAGEIALKYTVPAPKTQLEVTGAAMRPTWLDEIDTSMKIELIRRATEKKE